MLAHYLRAFLLALKITLRGEPPPPPEYAARYPELFVWMRQGIVLLEAVYAVAENHRMDRAARQAVILHLDRRDISMETILASVGHHLIEEYPYLLRHSTPHSFFAVYASNLDDRYRVAQLQAILEASPVQPALAALRAHLDAIPSKVEGSAPG